MTPSQWPGPAEVHLHWALLGDGSAIEDPGPAPHLHPWLSPPETERAARFAAPRLTRRWVQGRLFLREALGDLLGTHPALVPLRVGAGGRPFVAGLTDAADVNLSHTDHVVVLAVAAQRVGVDVEESGRVAGGDLLRTADVVSTAAEQGALARIAATDTAADGTTDESGASEAFARLWVRKEAVLKAEGSGFLRDPREVHVGVDDDGARDVRVDGAVWAVRDVLVPGGLDAPSGHVAAVATRGTCHEIRSYLRV